MDKVKIWAAVLAFVVAAGVTVILTAQEGACAEPGEGVGRVIVPEENGAQEGCTAVVDVVAERENPNDATKFLNRPFVESEWTCVPATAYCSCAECCGAWGSGRPVDENGEEIVVGAFGEVLVPGVSVASSVYPAGTVLEVYGYGTYIVEDCGGMPGGVDFFTGSHEDAVVFGLREVYVREVTK